MDEHYLELEQWYSDNFLTGMLDGSNGCKLRYAFQERTSDKGVLLIVSGRTEFIEKYLELSSDLQSTGLSVCMYEHCGQGRAGRLLPDRQKGHIDDFTTYVNDLGLVIDAINERYGSVPIYLLSHSMGGTITVIYTVRHPRNIKSVVLVSPMFQIQTGVLLPPIVVEVISFVFSMFGRKYSYVFGGGPFDSYLPFMGNNLTTDKHRFALNQGLMEQRPDIALGSPTFGWLSSAYRAMRRARKSAGLIDCPILLLEAKDDSIVGTAQMRTFCSKAHDCQYRTFSGGRHELLMENDAIRSSVVQEIKMFLERQTGE